MHCAEFRKVFGRKAIKVLATTATATSQEATSLRCVLRLVKVIKVTEIAVLPAQLFRQFN